MWETIATAALTSLIVTLLTVLIIGLVLWGIIKKKIRELKNFAPFQEIAKIAKNPKKINEVITPEMQEEVKKFAKNVTPEMKEIKDKVADFLKGFKDENSSKKEEEDKKEETNKNKTK